jgi:tRNA-dihydrouridine synthase
MLTISPLKISMPAIQAALSGFSDRPMRVVARRFGAAGAEA